MFFFSLKIISLEDYFNAIAKATDKTSEQKSSSLLSFYLQLLQAIILMTVVARFLSLTTTLTLTENSAKFNVLEFEKRI